MKVSLLGATGLVGSCLLDILLSSDKISEVYTFSRSEISSDQDKLKKFCDKNFSITNCPDLFFQADAMVSCLGTTIKKARTKQEFKRVDHDLPLGFSIKFKEFGGKNFVLLSSVGADQDSWVFYSKVKGLLEHEITKLNFGLTSIVRPSLLMGERKEKRVAEDLSKLLVPFLNPLLRGSLARYRAVHAEEVAKHLFDAILDIKVDKRIESIRIQGQSGG